MRNRKRSSCASGSGNVPSYSIGFWVASTMNGVGSGRVMPSTVTCCSSIASSSADCVLGVARLISSASTTWATIGPGAELELAGALVVDRDAGDVARQQVGRELDALEGAAGRARQALGQHRLADAGHVLDQQMPGGREPDDGQLGLGVFSNQDLLDRRDEIAQRLRAAHR